MAISVVMPALEMAQETGKLVSWRKKEGERVRKGELLLEVETDKAVVEIEALGDGILAGISAHEGAVIPVGQTIAWLVQPGETPPATAAPTQTGRRTDGGAAPQAVSVASTAPTATSGPIQISPKARRIAKEHGVDLSKVRGSGPGGEIVAEDVLSFASSASTAAAAENRVAPSAPSVAIAAVAPVGPLSTIGRIMAERTTESWTRVPHFFVTRGVDGTALVAAHQQLAPAIERTRNVKLTYTDLLTALVARVLRQHPRMNASWTGDAVRANPDVNVGLAMAVTDAVVVAVVHKADMAALGDIAVQRRDLAERARAGKLQPADITGATFTISNLGMYHVDAFTAIIVPLQAGILAVGALTDRVVPVPGGIGVRPILNLTLSCDHRVVDGVRGASFLHDVVEALQEADKRLG